MDLWPHQTEALTKLRSSLGSGKRRPMLQAPTGSGKTRLAAAIVEGAQRKENRVVFTVPAIELIDQTVQAFWREGIRDIGVIQADHPMTNARCTVQVASVQTLVRRRLPEADIVIVDEAHRAFKVVHEWMASASCPFVGLSATPWTRGLGKHYDDLIVAATTGELIEREYLSPFRVFAPSHPDLSGVRTVAGDYHEGDLSDAMNKPILTADVVSTWLRLGEDRPTLCYGVDKAHAKSLERQFAVAGVPVAYVDDSSDRGERERIRKDFAAGRIKVVCNIGVLTTGVDWDVRCLILARPTKSEILFTQIVGRALRKAEGKADALILDHSDTTLRLGFVTDIHHEKLDDGKPKKAAARERKEPLPKACSACSFLKPPKVHKCPACGFAPERRADVVTEDGELVQMNGKKVQVDRATKQAWWSGLLWIGQERGYRSGWAARQYLTKFKVWPRGLSDHAAEPSSQVRNWVTASLIRYAKSQRAA